MSAVRNALRYHLSSVEILGQSTARLSQIGDEADEHVRCNGLSRYLSKDAEKAVQLCAIALLSRFTPFGMLCVDAFNELSARDTPVRTYLLDLTP